MNILGIQLIGIIFGIIFTFFTYINIKKDKLKVIDGTMWIIVWLLLTLVSINPMIINFIAVDIFKMSRALDFIIISSFMLMFAVLYYMYLVVKNTEKRVETLVRNIAIEQNSKKQVTNKKPKTTKRK